MKNFGEKRLILECDFEWWELGLTIFFFFFLLSNGMKKFLDDQNDNGCHYGI